MIHIHRSRVQLFCFITKPHVWGLPGGLVVENFPANAGDAGLIPGSGRSPGEGNGNPLQYSCLENPKDIGAWQAIVHGVTTELDKNYQLKNNNSVCVCMHHMHIIYPAATAAKSLQSCPTLCNPIDGSPPDSLIPGILQAGTLEWVAISFSNA